jgi:hypothetical protein
MALWGLAALSTVWRRVIVRLAGPEVVSVARSLGVRPRPIFAGWRVEAGALRVDWRGGFRGETTLIRVRGGRRHRVLGALDANRVHAALHDLQQGERPSR